MCRSDHYELVLEAMVAEGDHGGRPLHRRAHARTAQEQAGVGRRERTGGRRTGGTVEDGGPKLLGPQGQAARAALPDVV